MAINKNTSKYCETRLSGSGGQGLILAGIILCCEYAPRGIEAYAMLSPLLNSVIFIFKNRDFKNRSQYILSLSVNM